MRKPAPLAVDVPSPERDKPAWVKVGVIAAVGFVVGIAWPRIVGVRVGPSAPGEGAAAASAQASAARAAEAPTTTNAKTAAPAQAPSAAPATSAAAPAPASIAAASTASQAPTISVNKGSVLSCKTSDGETKKGNKECGAVPALDSLVLPRLRKLSACAGAEGQSGKLSFVVTADFDKNKLTHDIGKSSTVGNLDQVTACVKQQFAGVSLGNVAHEHARYTVAYNAQLAIKDAGREAATPSAKEAEPRPRAERGAKKEDEKVEKTEQPASAPGEATVAWEVALVRDVPKTGEVVARLPRGTKVKVGAIKDGWYAIKFGDGFATEGYVYRGAVGR